MQNGYTSPIHIRSILKLLPADTLEHMRRVSILVDTLSKKLATSGLIQEDVHLLHACNIFGAAAFYHDIGKAQIPPYILTKPGKLTVEELGIIRRHPSIAQTIFREMQTQQISGISPQLIPHAFASAVCHHEQWCGSGYPYGTSQEGIPLIARITAICDAYDAMTVERQYRAARTHEEACRELLDCAGTQFDPLLVQVFIRNSETFGTLHKQNRLTVRLNWLQICNRNILNINPSVYSHTN